AQAASAQGITTAALSGTVIGTNGAPLAGATVTAVHVPSGTRYEGITRSDGRYTMPGMRVGGPYRVTVSFLGFEDQVRENITLNLGTSSDVSFNMRETALRVDGITVTAAGQGAIMSPDRTGAATAV